jgi:hypothetical protein
MKKLILTKKEFFRILKESAIEALLDEKDHLGWDSDEEVMERLQTAFIDTFGIDNLGAPQYDRSSFLSFKLKTPSGSVFEVHLDEPYDLRVTKLKSSVLVFDKNLASEYEDFNVEQLVRDLQIALQQAELKTSPERKPNFKPRDPFVYSDDQEVVDKSKLNEHNVEVFVKKLFQKD